MEEFIKEQSVKFKAIMAELGELAKSLNELEQTEICSSINGWQFHCKKISEVEELKQ